MYLLINLAEKLRQKGYKVLVMGKNWDENEQLFKFQTLDIKHSEYPDIYNRSKIYISTSLQEGGPVSWIEAMASGCYTLSHQTGFASELRNKELMSFILPYSAKFNLWFESCNEIFENYKELSEQDYKARELFLEKFRFKNLAKALEKKLMQN